MTGWRVNKLNNKDMQNLSLTQQGTKGGEPTTRPNVGLIIAETDNDVKISVDAFSGYGDTYKRRAEHLITISSKGQPVFIGTAAELLAKLNH